MEKTAMQELIDKLEAFAKDLKIKYDDDPLVLRGIRIAIAEAKKLLPKEQKQINELEVIVRRFNNHAKLNGYPSKSFREKVNSYLTTTSPKR